MKEKELYTANCIYSDVSGLGVLGGTFDPIHVGHVAMARQAAREFSLESVIVLPASDPPHKSAHASVQHRLAMAALALENEPGLMLSTLEADRPGKTFTVESLKRLREMYSGKRLYYIIGSDTLLELPSWRSAGEVTRLCDFIVFYRHGAELSRARGVQAELPGLSFHFAKLDVPNVSSTEIRARARSGAPLRSLVCPAVEVYITQNGLYLDT